MQKFKAKKNLLSLVAPVQEDEPVLQAICDTFERVANNAKAAAAVQRTVGLVALYQMERKEIHIKPSNSLNSRLEGEPWA